MADYAEQVPMNVDSPSGSKHRTLLFAVGGGVLLGLFLFALFPSRPFEFGVGFWIAFILSVVTMIIGAMGAFLDRRFVSALTTRAKRMEGLHPKL